MSKREEILRQKQIQYEALDKLFGAKVDMKTMFRRLLELERKGERIGLRTCNEPNYDYEKHEEFFEKEVHFVFDEIFKDSQKAKSLLYINYDPRGYCLKMDDGENGKTYLDSGIWFDWGRYGIFMPDFSHDD